MWSWLIIGLISLVCIFCFISIVHLELRKPFVMWWVFATCISIAVVVWVLVNVPNPNMQKYSYEPKPPQIDIKKISLTGGTEEIEEISNTEKVMVIVSKLDVWSDNNANAHIIGHVKYSQVLTVLDAPAGLDLIKIKTNEGLTGWVVKSYVRVFPGE